MVTEVCLNQISIYTTLFAIRRTLQHKKKINKRLPSIKKIYQDKILSDYTACGRANGFNHLEELFGSIC